MAYNIRTIIKLFMIFLTFNICLVSIIELMPILNDTMTQDDQNYRTFLNSQVNFLSTNTTTLLEDFKNRMPGEGTWNDNISKSFLGVYKVIASVIKFIVVIAWDTLTAPSTMGNILLYSLGVNLAMFSIIISIGFYSLMFYIIFNTGTK